MMPIQETSSYTKSYSVPRSIPEGPFDPVEMAHIVDKTVSNGKERIYSCFSISPNFDGSVKGYAVGCNLRCRFCWSPCRSLREIQGYQSRIHDVAEEIHKALTLSAEGNGKYLQNKEEFVVDLEEVSPHFFSPEEVVERMFSVFQRRISSGIGKFELYTEGAIPSKFRYYTISGGEPTICRSHLIGVLEEFFKRDCPERFLLQSNGFLFGSDKSYLEELIPFREKRFEIRISIKAGTPEALLRRTGMTPNAFDLPFHAIDQLLSLDFNFHLAAMSDSSVMSSTERNTLLSRLSTICAAYGKSLKMFDDDLGESHKKLGTESNEKKLVMLDEESYVPIFTHVLAKTLNKINPEVDHA